MERWSIEKANAWYEKLPWTVGCNYVTSNAVNDVEMWMNETFDPELIRKELKMAHDIGFNSIRVFLSFTVWEHEGNIFEDNFETFLKIASEAGISVMPVLFDDCAFDGGSDPQYGKQPDPKPGVHNSRWVPSPGFRIQDDPQSADKCRDYVVSIISKHSADDRIILWDLFNEPGNTGRKDKSLPLLENSFRWARECSPAQPVTTGMWLFSPDMDNINRTCSDLSDIESIHAYCNLEETKRRLNLAAETGRPVIVTEWFHRAGNNGYSDHLPFFKGNKVGIWQWGMIVGKTQTNLSWAGQKPGETRVLWQHDLMTADGTPYDPEEIRLLKELTGRI